LKSYTYIPNGTLVSSPFLIQNSSPNLFKRQGSSNTYNDGTGDRLLRLKTRAISTARHTTQTYQAVDPGQYGAAIVLSPAGPYSGPQTIQIKATFNTELQGPPKIELTGVLTAAAGDMFTNPLDPLDTGFYKFFALPGGVTGTVTMTLSNAISLAGYQINDITNGVTTFNVTP